MNDYFIREINTNLSTGIIKGYKSGLRYIVNKNKKLIKLSDPLFDISYTITDKLAIKNFLIEAFKVAGIGSYELEEKLKDLGVKVIEGEIPDFESFELEARNAMLQYGIGLGDQPPTGWLETNLNTAITSSISAAKWIRINDPDVTDVYPALMFRTQRDERVRDEHAELDGKVFYKDDPIWDTIYPPIDWNCRCYTEPMTAEDLQTNPAKIHDEAQSKAYKKIVGKDFKFNPGKEKSIWKRWLDMKFDDMDDSVKAEIKDKLKKYKKEIEAL